MKSEQEILSEIDELVKSLKERGNEGRYFVLENGTLNVDEDYYESSEEEVEEYYQSSWESSSC